MFYQWNNCSNVEDIYSLVYSCMQDTMGKLSIQTWNSTTFQYSIMCILTLAIPTLQVIYGHSTYQKAALLLEISIFCVRAGCEIWMASHPSKHTSQSVWAALNFEKTSDQLLGVNPNFRFHQNLAGRRTPWKSRPRCPYKRKALLTTHSHLFDRSTQSSLVGIGTHCWISFKFISSCELKNS